MIILLENLLLIGAVVALVYSVHRLQKGIRLSQDADKGNESAADSDTFSARRGFKNIAYAAGIPLPFPLLIFGLVELGGICTLLLWNEYEVRWPGYLAFIVIPSIAIGILYEIGRKRALRFEEKLIEAIELLIGALRSGDSLRNSFEGLVENSEAPIQTEFRKLLIKLDLGFDMRRALLPIVQRYDSEGLRLFAATLTAKSKLGGDLVPVFESLNKVLRDRLRFRVRVNSKLGAAKSSAIMIGASPYVLLLLFYFYKKDWLDRLFLHEFGPTLFVAAVCVQLLGLAGIFKMQRMEL